MISTDLPAVVSPTLEDLLSAVREYMPPGAVDSVQRAHDFAAEAHRGQMRKSGEPYLVHLIATAYYLARLHLDVTSIVAGMLHDTIEDTEVTYEDLEGEFGHGVARIVEGVSKFGEIGHRHRPWTSEPPARDGRRQPHAPPQQQHIHM